jgi:NTE family protein
MRIPLGVVATDLSTGAPVSSAESGEVFKPIRASCAYPGLFQPVSHKGYQLVDGAMSVGVPAALARQLGATHVISVSLPAPGSAAAPRNMLQVVSRCMQILQSQFESSWRSESDLVIAPEVTGIEWNAFDLGQELVQADEAAAEAVVSRMREWCSPPAAAAPILRIGMAF